MTNHFHLVVETCCRPNSHDPVIAIQPGRPFSNVFLRFFTKDDAGQHARAEDLFRAGAEGRTPLISGPPVLFEIAWTLRAAYGQSSSGVLDVLEAILALPGFELTDAAVCAEAVRLARQSGVDFPDAYTACGLQSPVYRSRRSDMPG